MKTVTRCPKNRDEIALSPEQFVTLSVTSLYYHTFTAWPGLDVRAGGSHDTR